MKRDLTDLMRKIKKTEANALSKDFFCTFHGLGIKKLLSMFSRKITLWVSALNVLISYHYMLKYLQSKCCDVWNLFLKQSRKNKYLRGWMGTLAKM